MPRGSKPGETRQNAGRTKGAVNKNKTALIEKLNKLVPGYDPLVEMAKIGDNPENDLSMRLAAHKEVAQYIVPKLKAIDHTHRGDADAPVVVEQRISDENAERLKTLARMRVDGSEA